MILIELLKLFWIFFKISIFTFGGGYAMMPLIIQEMTSKGYLTSEQLYQFIGIAESTPGVFSINVATFAGFENFGFAGAVVATLGIVVPPFLIILLIASISDKFIKHPAVTKVLDYLKPAIIGFILAAAFNVAITATIKDVQNISFEWQAITIFGLMTVLTLIFRSKFKPIMLILLSGLLGLGLYLL